ncbi:hypothetical protein SCLCIDRAFT_503474 [Scleroderma citrinum Foug A]|uniref:Rab proteins geranylgeranyltransferase n=1 Tax=Scleroderma citrinum Foug A TaxID=1036808 RepID=A0A0C3EBH3_9AGAM|nr:hypothetical protein SCLCIDRAFT_503474 [Scleroderma citrinum Foug A]
MENEFDTIILGTGLAESITAAALAKAGLKVAHIDPNAYYGADEATLTLDEVIAWAKRQSSPDHTHQNERCTRYDVEFLSEVEVSHPRQYTISLSPSVIPAVGPFITSITASGVARYASFKLLGSVSIYHDGHFENVPRGKEDVFRDQQIPLVEKRRLMRFLMFAAGEYESSPEFQGKEDVPFLEFLCQTFSLSENIAQIVAFALAYCNSADEPTSSALSRVQTCLRSTGRYGPSPFLVSYYGGSGELAQGFCRAAAVNGGVYILGRRITNIAFNDDSDNGHRYTVELDDFPDPLFAPCLLSSSLHVPDHLRQRVAPILSEPSQPPPRAVVRGVVILDDVVSPPCDGDEESQMERSSDSLIMVFPTASVEGGSNTCAVHALTVGPGTMCTPPGKSIFPLSSRSLWIAYYIMHQVSFIYLCLCTTKREAPRNSSNPTSKSFSPQSRHPTIPSSKCITHSTSLHVRHRVHLWIPMTRTYGSSLWYLLISHMGSISPPRLPRRRSGRSYRQFGGQMRRWMSAMAFG